MENEALKEILEQHNIEEILKLMGFDVVAINVNDVHKNGNYIGYNETITVEREVR